MKIGNWRTIGRLLLSELIYRTIVGFLSTGAAVLAGSTVLMGFGLFCLIEATVAYTVWGLAPGEITGQQESRLFRLMGWTFLALSAFILVKSSDGLIHRGEVSPSKLGLAVVSTSLLIVPIIGLWMLRLASFVNSRGLQAKAKETIASVHLSILAVLGVGTRFFGGPSWLDPLAAILMIPWLIRAGVESTRRRAKC